MLRLFKFWKPYLGLVLLCIAILFAQANFDLALPDYLSRIVNVGIQQGGVENAVPAAIRQKELDRLTLFMSADDKAAVLNNYTLVNQDSADYAATLAKYPQVAKEPVYVLKTADQAEIDKLNPILAKPLLAVSGLEQALADPAKAEQMKASGFDLSRIPAGMDLFALLPKLPAAQFEKLTSALNDKFAALGDKMLIQAATKPVKAEYEALGVDMAKVQNDYVLATGAWMLALTLASVVCTIAVGFLSARVAAGMARDIRRALFQRVESFSNTEFDKFSTASLITRTTNDITQLQLVTVLVIRMVFYAPMMAAGGIIRVINKDFSMTWLILVAVLVLISLILAVLSVSLPKFRLVQTLVDRLNLVARENLAGLLVVRAFNMQPFEEQRFEKANKDLTAVSLFVNRAMVVMMPMMMLIMNGLTLAIIWVGAHQVAEANMQVGDMIAYMQYAMQIMFSFLMLSMLMIFLPRASVSGDRIADVLAVEPAIHDPEQPAPFPAPFRGSIEFREVSFRYPGADTDALQQISFTARPGELTGVIGATGAGKSTIVNLIPRFYDVTGGAILVDGVDIRQVKQHDLRDKLGLVPQKSSLFSGTIESNLRYADKEASDEQLKLAADIAQATEFITAKPEGMATEIAQGGTNVSGGQKQRLSIARALVKQPPIYIFDDSFSALDLKTDAALRRALQARTHGSTRLVVSQRVSTIKNAEQIIVLDEGRVVASGTHAQLMETCEIYREIAMSQLSQEALA